LQQLQKLNIFASPSIIKFYIMSLLLIPDFKKEGNSNIIKLIANVARKRDVDCMNLTGLCKDTGETPVYVFVSKNEVVILMLDWRSEPEEELADEEDYFGNPPTYFSSKNKRVSPVWKLSEFTRQYKQIMIDANVKLTYVWSVLITNSTFINYDDMTFYWDMMGITVFHGYGKTSIPPVHYSYKYYSPALAQYKAFRIWCERQGYLTHDPYAFEGIDAEYDEMEFGLDKDDNSVDTLLFEGDANLFDDIDDLTDDDFDEDDDDPLYDVQDSPDIDISQFPSGTIRLSQNKVINVEILKPIKSPREELEKMVGCQNIKTQISNLIELTKYNKWMRSQYPQWKEHQVSLHAIFLGRPGTGKTTVCKIYGGLLKEAGVLSKGHVVVCNRATFLGSNWGDEEHAIRQVLRKAKGGVLMIDEAYLLNSNHPNDPGKLILPQFMDILSNEGKRDVAIVLCGYKEPMQKLLDLNPGLASRFPNRFEFKDFSVHELLEITYRRLSEHGYHFTKAGLKKYKTVLTDAYNLRNHNNWGNARFVANLLENIYLMHAKRCMNVKTSLNPQTLFNITPSDIQPIDVPIEYNRIGF